MTADRSETGISGDQPAAMTQQGVGPDASREDLLSATIGLLERLHQMDKPGLTPEQHGHALMQYARIRDLSALEMSEHTAELQKTDACVEDWGSNSTIDWIRHTCHMPSGGAADLSHVGEQLPNLSKTIEAMREGKIGF